MTDRELSADEYNAIIGAVKPHKYGAIRTEVDWLVFPSKAEARRYSELKIMLGAGAIEDLELQPKYPLFVEGIKVCTYIPDFHYFDREKLKLVVEDVKSSATKTPVYRLKVKLMRAVYGIDVTEVTK